MSETKIIPAAATLNGRIEFLAAAKRLISDTRYNASLLTQVMDPRVFGDATFADAVKQFLLLQRNARLRVLVAQPQLAVRGPHALVDLGRLLASRVEFREFAPGKIAPAEEMLLADGRLLLERNSADALEARLIREDPATARERQRRFDNLWDHAVPSIELRRLSL
ncbi:MAG: hypothetical protein Q7J29_16100 [Stagnimonas sp.]|nr:hypothetical protein [Stagnimonas sp.]